MLLFITLCKGEYNTISRSIAFQCIWMLYLESLYNLKNKGYVVPPFVPQFIINLMKINTNKCSVSVFKVIHSPVFLGMCSEFCRYICKTVHYWKHIHRLWMVRANVSDMLIKCCPKRSSSLSGIIPLTTWTWYLHILLLSLCMIFKFVHLNRLVIFLLCRPWKVKATHDLCWCDCSFELTDC